MKILVVGGGGREHALVRKIAESPRVDRLWCAPGNAGIAAHADLVPITADDLDGLLRFAKSETVDLTVVGPEAPLCAGIVDLFEAEGLRIFGPRKNAAELEGSKIFAKDLMRKHGIPTATYRTFDDAENARAWLRSVLDWPVVIKADGLAAGKGVVLAESLFEADRAVRAMMEDLKYGEAGRRIVIEERLLGEEASILALTDGTTIALFESSQDHKAAQDNDQGPNTGGMGAYSPAPIVTSAVLDQVTRDILVPLVHAMNREHRPYRGVIYAGLMITKSGPRVLEFNVRFGDPEAQVVLPRLKTDLVDLMEACLDGTLSQAEIEWDPRSSLSVVIASGGYPGSYEKGKAIRGLDRAAQLQDVFVYHAGTSLLGETIVTSGGRVLDVTALGEDLEAARDRAYEAVGEIFFEGRFFRSDIGHHALPGSGTTPAPPDPR